jgi:hypothetical protein
VTAVIWLLVFKEDTMNNPNPGSEEAIELGCECPVMDNNHGKGLPWPNGRGGYDTAFWTNGDCPLHGKKDKQKEG